MNIKEFSKQLNVSAHTIRYYEQEGLLNSDRSSNNYRSYNNTDIQNMRLVLALKAMNMPLKDIKTIMQLKARETSLQCKQSTLDFIDHHLNNFKTHLNLMTKFIQVLEELQQSIQQNEHMEDEQIFLILNQLNSKDNND